MTTENNAQFYHQSVLPQEIIDSLNIINNGHYLDATLGAGGHTELILKQGENVKITAIDQDINAINFAQEKLKNYQDKISFFQGNFADFKPFNTLFDGIIADLGVSSPN